MTCADWVSIGMSVVAILVSAHTLWKIRADEKKVQRLLEDSGD